MTTPNAANRPTWLSRARLVFVLGTAVLTFVAVCFAIANVAFEHFLQRQARSDLARLETGASRLSFEFDSLRDLISEGAVGARSARIVDGVLRADLAEGKANFRLNFRGLNLSAARFSTLAARLELAHAADLVLIFDEPGQLDENAVRIALKAGWNALEIDLARETWRPVRAPPTVSATVAWGGQSALIGEFRAYIEGPRQQSVGLDYFRFLATPAAAARVQNVEWIHAAEMRHRLQKGDAQMTAREQIPGVLLPLWRDTPERLMDFRDRVRAVDAEALFWPDSRRLTSGSDLANTSSASYGWRISGGWLLLIAVGMLVVRWRVQANTAIGAIAELIAGLGPILLLAIGLGIGERANASSLILLMLSLAYMLSRVEFNRRRWLGTTSAWKLVALCSLSAMLPLLLVGAWTSAAAWPGSQRALLYLPFVVVQQTLLLGFIFPHCARLSLRFAPALAGLLFALTHAPNFSLMLATGAAAFLWCHSYAKHRALLPIVCSHYLLGMLAVSLLPPTILYSAEISLRYFLLR